MDKQTGVLRANCGLRSISSKGELEEKNAKTKSRAVKRAGKARKKSSVGLKCDPLEAEKQKGQPLVNAQKKQKKGKTSDIMTSRKQTETPSNAVSKKSKGLEECELPPSDYQGMHSGNLSKKSDIPASVKTTATPSGDVSKKNNTKPGLVKISNDAPKKSKKRDISTNQDGRNNFLSKRKTEIKLRPSEIRYSQGSISSQFKDGTNIGELLDDIFFGRCFASAIPKIEVSCIKSRWVSADNRRLWVFKQLEMLGKVDLITVKLSRRIYTGKLTSGNKGTDIDIRNGKPKGIVYSLLYGEPVENEDGCVTRNQESVPKRKTKRRPRRRAKKSENTSSNFYQSENQSEIDSETSSEANTPSDESDLCNDNYINANSNEALLQYNQNFMDENTYFEIYDYSDSEEDWTDEGNISDVAVSGSADETRHDWYEYKRDIDTHLYDFTPYEAPVKEQLQTKTPARFQTKDNYKMQKQFDSSSEVWQPLNNSDVIKAGLEYENKRSVRYKNASKPTSGFHITHQYNDLISDNDFEISDSDVGFDDFSVKFHSETCPSYRPDDCSYICGNYDCARCARRIFYNDLGIESNIYFEPPCNRPRVRSTVSSYGSALAGNYKIKDKETSGEKSFLSKVADSIAGFLNVIFN